MSNEPEIALTASSLQQPIHGPVQRVVLLCGLVWVFYTFTLVFGRVSVNRRLNRPTCIAG